MSRFPAFTSAASLTGHRKPAKGFTMVELVVVIIVLGILAAVAVPRIVAWNSSARIASLHNLEGSLKASIGLVKSLTTIRGAGAAGTQAGITWVTMTTGNQIRVWSGYPDRWCDGIAATQQGVTPPPGGCYLSTAPVVVDGYTFYGFGNSQIPNGDAGWRIENSPTPKMCSIQYTYAGSGVPVITVNVSGC